MFPVDIMMEGWEKLMISTFSTSTILSRHKRFAASS
jgi:hypothetical protein